MGLGPLLWLAAGPLHSGPADAFPPRLYDQTLAGTCWVVVGEGESPRTGTGWLVDQSRRLVVTNQHVVGDAKAAVVLFPLFHQGQPVTGRVFYTRNRPHMIHALLLDSDERRDLAILELERLPDQARALLLAERPVAVGQRLWVIGNPRGEFGLWTPRAGRVLDLTTDVMKYRSGQEVEARLIRAELPIQAGFSGGPLVNDRGQVVGICTAWREATYCIDIAEVRTFLARALRLRAHRALAAKKFDDAIRDCDESLRHNPDDPQTYNTRGAAYSFQDDYDRAIADYTQAIRLDPNFAVAYRNRGSCWYLKGDDEQAIRDCTRAIRLDATDARAYERRGQAYARRGERDRAEADFAVARRLRAGK